MSPVVIALFCFLLFQPNFAHSGLCADDESMQSEIVKQKPGFADILNLAEETKAMNELRRLATAVAVTVNTEEIDSEGKPVRDISFKKLVERELIPQYLESGQSGKYEFSIEPDSYEYNVHADPIDQNSSLRHFMIDSEGNMHVDRGQAATKDSPRA